MITRPDNIMKSSFENDIAVGHCKMIAEDEVITEFDWEDGTFVHGHVKLVYPDKFVYEGDLKGGLAVECGDAGIGKTKAALKYAADYPNTAIYISVNPCLVSITSFLKTLCRYFKITPGRKDDMWFDVESRLRGGHKVLIIDEAQHLPIKTVEAVRAFYDCNPGLGVVLISNAETVNNRGGRKKESFSQIVNRTKLTEIRHTANIIKEDIKLLFPDIDAGKALSLVHWIAKGEQGICGAVNLYSNAADNRDTSFNGLLKVAKAMKIETAGWKFEPEKTLTKAETDGVQLPQNQ